MNLSISVVSEAPAVAAAVGHIVFEGLTPASSDISIDADLASLRSFTGKPGETLVATSGGQLRVLVGAGAKSGYTARQLRRAAATFIRSVPGAPEACLDLNFDHSDDVGVAVAVQAVVEGAGGAAYRFWGFKSGGEAPKLASLTIAVAEADLEAARRGLALGLATASAVSLARDLGNTPPSDMTPRHMAGVATEVAERSGLEIKILEESAIEESRLGGLLGVSRGSAEPPRVIQLSYTPAGDAEVPTVALVGKGITFDSGGLSLKSGEGMMTMKDDMSGAAAVISVLGACKDAGVKVKVLGVCMCSENMPSGTATKPGDVLRTRSGKTIEVLNTDAEGRLVLSDGLTLAVEAGPDAIIDIATLTGACVVALGSDVAGIMSNDSRLVAAVATAAAKAGEGVWQLPLPRQYRDFFKSDIADMKNIGRAGNAGALVAGLILQEFVADRPWVHIDIAGPAFTDDDSFDRRKGSTGFIVRTLLELLANYEGLGTPADLLADGSI